MYDGAGGKSFTGLATSEEPTVVGEKNGRAVRLIVGCLAVLPLHCVPYPFKVSLLVSTE